MVAFIGGKAVIIYGMFLEEFIGVGWTQIMRAIPVSNFFLNFRELFLANSEVVK